MVAIVGLAEDLAVAHDGGVGGDDDPSRRRRGRRLLAGQPLDVLGGGFVGSRRFVDGGRLDGGEHAEASEELAAARGTGGENDLEIRHGASLARDPRRATRPHVRPPTLCRIETPDAPDDPTAPQAADEVRELPTELPPPTAEEIQPEDFIVTTGFFRAGTDPIRLPQAPDGPTYTQEEADAAAHQFFAALASGRDLEHEHDDPIEHARANGLMMLFSEGVGEVFETHLARMPDDLQARWRDLIAGGARSEAFGPLTLQERLDERAVEESIVAGRKQRVINLVVGGLAIAVIAVGVWWGWQEFGVEEQRTRGALQFADSGATAEQAAVEGGAPVVEPLLTVALSETVSVLAGDGPVADRVTTAPFVRYPYPPGAIGASVFQYANSGHVVLVGPDGFTDVACMRVSVVTSDLRPLDTVTHGPCTDPVGREATVGCIGDTALLLALDIPAGAVELPEGGTGLADAIRLQLVADGAPEYEVLSIRGTIQVDPDSGVVIPRFGGEVGEEMTFDIGSGRVGTCTLTGNLPEGA